MDTTHCNVTDSQGTAIANILSIHQEHVKRKVNNANLLHSSKLL